MSNPLNLIEGSLNIRRDDSSESRATPRYHLMFARYEELNSKRHPRKQIVGDEALEIYLLNFCLAPEMAKHWLSKIKNTKSVSIPNVMLPAQFIGDFESPDRS